MPILFTEATAIPELLGKTMKSVEDEHDTLVFTGTDETRYVFYHSQNCCEHVSIEDVCGDLADLVGTPITLAEEVCSESGNPDDDTQGTWTFYRFETVKGTVTVRWYGISNGYYSESVSFKIVKNISENYIF